MADRVPSALPALDALARVPASDRAAAHAAITRFGAGQPVRPGVLVSWYGDIRFLSQPLDHSPRGLFCRPTADGHVGMAHRVQGR